MHNDSIIQNDRFTITVGRTKRSILQKIKIKQREVEYLRVYRYKRVSLIVSKYEKENIYINF